MLKQSWSRHKSEKSDGVCREEMRVNSGQLFQVFQTSYRFCYVGNDDDYLFLWFTFVLINFYERMFQDKDRGL